MPAKRTLRPIIIAVLITLLGLTAVSSASAQQGSLGNIISQDNRFSAFEELVQQAGLTSLLQQTGPFTVLVPTNEAIANLPAGTLSNQTSIRQTVLHHIFRGKYSSAQLSQSNSKQSALGQNHTFRNQSGAIVVDGNATITIRDVQASNGTIHGINAVLLPPWIQPTGTGGNDNGGGASSGSTTTGGGGNALPPTPVSGSGPTVVNITDQIALQGAKRLGVNIGKRDQYGAAQYIKNLVPNPGFEAGEFAMVFVTWRGATGTRVQADNWETAWNNEPRLIGQPAGFWNGATFEVLHGSGKGRSGTINNFTHDGGRYTFYLSGNGTIAHGDVIVVRKQMSGFEADTNRYNKAEPNNRRPGSPGRQALRLLPTPGWLASLL